MNTTQERGPEGAHRLVGRYLAVEDSICAAMLATPNTESHAHDLLVIARDAVHRAALTMWGKAPEIPDQQPDAAVLKQSP